MSSVSSEKQIQHLRTSTESVLTPAGRDVEDIFSCVCSFVVVCVCVCDEEEGFKRIGS